MVRVLSCDRLAVIFVSDGEMMAFAAKLLEAIKVCTEFSVADETTLLSAHYLCLLTVV